MKALPGGARIFLFVVCVLGCACFVLSQLFTLPAEASTTLGELVVFISLAAIVGGKKVILAKGLKNEEVGTMSFGFALTFAALLRFGPQASVLVAIACSLSYGLFPHRQPSARLAFNTSLAAIEAFAGGLVYVAANGGSLVIDGATSFVAVLQSALAFFLINTTGVTTMVALSSHSSLLKLWRKNLLWRVPGYLAWASLSALAIAMFRTSVPSSFLFAIPVLYLLYHTYASYSRKIEQDEAQVQALEHSRTQLEELYLATIKSFALAVDAKDPHTHEHIIRVQRYAVAIALQMGLIGDDLEAVSTGALLHDIGKLGIPENVLLKRGLLSTREYDEVKKHPEIGATILGPVKFPWPVLAVVRHHHEKWDGSGYPDGLQGEKIPLAARIMAVADVYDALTSDRSYREAWTHDRAVEWIKGEAGRHFDPKVVKAFLDVMHSRIAAGPPTVPFMDMDMDPESLPEAA